MVVPKENNSAEVLCHGVGIFLIISFSYSDYTSLSVISPSVNIYISANDHQSNNLFSMVIAYVTENNTYSRTKYLFSSFYIYLRFFELYHFQGNILFCIVS